MGKATKACKRALWELGHKQEVSYWWSTGEWLVSCWKLYSERFRVIYKGQSRWDLWPCFGDGDKDINLEVTILNLCLGRLSIYIYIKYLKFSVGSLWDRPFGAWWTYARSISIKYVKKKYTDVKLIARGYYCCIAQSLRRGGMGSWVSGKVLGQGLLED